MTRPRLLDLFCGAGGCSVGYHRAGFDVVGVDIEPHPDYPYELIVADAVEVLQDKGFLADFDVIHASPPCQAYANVTAWRGQQSDHPELISDVRDALNVWAGPWIMENVPEAPIRADYLLCGSQFGLSIRRHRAFELGGWSAFELLPPCTHRNLLPFMHKQERAYAAAMGVPWMTNRDSREAVPPAYTEYIGAQLLDQIGLAA